MHPVEDPAQAWNACPRWAPTPFSLTSALSGVITRGGGPWRSPETCHRSAGRESDSIGSGRPSPTLSWRAATPRSSRTGADVDWPESLQILTTRRDPPTFTTTNATSAATAWAAHLAAIVAAEHPGFWPETVPGVARPFCSLDAQTETQLATAGSSRRKRAHFIRRYGFGVPTTERALRSATDALTLIVQDTIHPFRRGALREMGIDDLPWPRNELAGLGEVPVAMKVTLSYFIEPSPTCRGFRRRCRYASHQLRFDVREPDQSNNEFRKRINKKALAEEEERPTRSADADGWYIGSEGRNRGSLHSDIWTGTATDLAARGFVAIYPVTGWWKELPARDQSEIGARYALLISIETPVDEVDIWTPVAIEAEVPVTVVETLTPEPSDRPLQ